MHLGLLLLPYIFTFICFFRCLEVRRTGVCDQAVSLSLSRRIQPSNPPEYSSTYYAYIIFPALGFVALCLYSLFLCYVLCPVSPRRLFIAYVYTSFSFVFFSRAIISVWKKKVLAGLRELRLREETFRLYSTNHGLQRQMLQQISSK